MRQVWVYASCLLMCSACAGSRTSRQEPQLPRPTERVLVHEEIRCPEQAAPVPEEPRAEDAAAAGTEEHALTTAFTTLATITGALWDCINTFNADAKERNSK